MESQLQRYARRLVEEQLGHSRLQLAQIADDISTVKTEQDTKFTGDKEKTHGLVCIPVYSKVGVSTARKVEAVVDTIFNKGEAAISTVTR